MLDILWFWYLIVITTSCLESRYSRGKKEGSKKLLDDANKVNHEWKQDTLSWFECFFHGPGPCLVDSSENWIHYLNQTVQSHQLKIMSKGRTKNVTGGPNLKDGELILGVVEIWHHSMTLPFMWPTCLGKESMVRITDGMKVSSW